ncbi:MAG: molybdopterin converting factor subunit 1 [Alphaproteobacteria bacterium]|jgi:molybdopterin synthase sulfur carrier subunit|nr:molybdopterin converting factor subunit 1 [Alphaproteobacteria bacterium]
MKILYFAWLRQQTGIDTEEVEAPGEVTDVAGLLDWLKTRGPGHAAALADLSAVRVAVNQEFAELDAEVAPGDEVAIFPPMTGG